MEAVELERTWQQYYIESDFLPKIRLAQKFERCLGIRQTPYGPGVALLVYRMREGFRGAVSILVSDAQDQVYDAAWGNMHLGRLVKVPEMAN